MPSDKPEFQPLLPAGFHEFTLDSLHAFCVKPFTLSHTRARIFDGLTFAVGRLREVEVVGSIWVNGGFMTESINPEDVDFILCLKAEFYDNCSEVQRDTVAWIRDDVKLRSKHHCHSNYIIEWPESHLLYAEARLYRAQWLDWFGYSRRPNRTEKGIGVIIV